MNILADTHIALWAITEDRRLTRAAKSLLTSPENRIWVSTVSLFEIATKRFLRKAGPGAIAIPAAEAFHQMLASGFKRLDLKPEHIFALEALAPHHSDPFDRLLVAQAQHEPMRLLTHDEALSVYGPLIIAV